MKKAQPTYVIDLTAYTLYVTCMIVSPFITPKYFILLNIPASASVLIAPVSLLILCFFTEKYGSTYVYKIIKRSICINIIIACLIKVFSYIPMDLHSLVSPIIWQHIMGNFPQLAIAYACLYGLVQAIVVEIYTQKKFNKISLNFLLSTWIAYISVAACYLCVIKLYKNLTAPPLEIILGTILWFIMLTSATTPFASILQNNAKKIWLKDPSHTVYSHTKREDRYTGLLIVFWMSILLTNLLVVRCFTLANRVFTLSLLTYPLSFVATDLISELYGKQQAKYAVWTGFLASITMMATIVLMMLLPIYNASPYTEQNFNAFFRFNPGIVLASMLAYICAQFTDIHLFELLRLRTQGKHLWLRNNLATMTSQWVDTLIFTFFVWVIWPKIHTTPSAAKNINLYWYQLAMNEYIGKMILALLDTPVVYFILRLFKTSHKKYLQKSM